MDNVQVSFLMSVYKEDDSLLEKSLESVLSQTFGDFEAIIIDDGMTEGNLNIVKKFNDSRIRLVKNEFNLGLTKSLNKAAGLAHGKYLARLDSDDWCVSNRLEVQFQFMEENPDYILCGSRVKECAPGGVPIEGLVKFVGEDEEIRNALSVFNPFAHSTLFMRKSAFELAGGYDESYRFAQDYDLIYRLAKNGKVKNISDVLVFRNLCEKSISVKKQKLQLYHALRTRVRAFITHGGGLCAIKKFIVSFVVFLLPVFVVQKIRSMRG